MEQIQGGTLLHVEPAFCDTLRHHRRTGYTSVVPGIKTYTDGLFFPVAIKGDSQESISVSIRSKEGAIIVLCSDSSFNQSTGCSGNLWSSPIDFTEESYWTGGVTYAAVSYAYRLATCNFSIHSIHRILISARSHQIWIKKIEGFRILKLKGSKMG